MNLFQLGEFTLHSGSSSKFKIDCDALTPDDWATLALLIADRFKFSRVEGVMGGGFTLFSILIGFETKDANDPLLIVDDVLTTGASMEAERAGRDAIGVVVFARGPCPSWIHPIFQMWPEKVK